jgi:GNAT superfamily N-acetyltransferase
MARAEVTIEALGADRRVHDEAAVVAARAFYDDPFFDFMSRRPLQRARALGLFFRTMVVGAGEGDRLLCARDGDGHVVGIAVWLRPGSYPPPIPTQLRQLAGCVRALALNPRALVEGPRYLTAMDKVHPREPHWYLELLAVDPSVQRSGIGTLLQEPVLEEADRDGLPCYLETQDPDNLPYYRRFAYDVEHELRPIPARLPLWTMRREPR